MKESAKTNLMLLCTQSYSLQTMIQFLLVWESAKSATD